MMELSRRDIVAATFGAGALMALGPMSTLEAAAAVTMQVTASSLTVRTGPGTSYSRVGSLARGTRVTGNISGGWMKLTSGPYTGRWVSAAYLKAVVTHLPYVTKITPVVGGVHLKLGWNGTRVGLVQRKLGIQRTGSGQTYDAATRDAVKAYQRRNGLYADGIVGPKTWAKMNLGWAFTIDAYQVQPQLPFSAVSGTRIEKMISYATAQKGSRYSWGGAGPYDLGFDCSGLVLQAIYASGKDPQPINVIKHAQPTYRTSRELYAHEGMNSFPVSQRRRGDLLFYTNSSGTINHVAIYLGNNQMIESVHPVARVTSVRTTRLAPRLRRVYP